MDYFYIGIDDTDSPDGMCTTYLASSILNEFERNAIEIEDFPRLIYRGTQCGGDQNSYGFRVSH